MGLVLDSSVIIAGERRGHTVREILEDFKTRYGETEIAVSVVTIVELTHGVQLAKLKERRQSRQAFVDELIRDVPVHPVNSGDSQTRRPNRRPASRAGGEFRFRGSVDRRHCIATRVQCRY